MNETGWQAQMHSRMGEERNHSRPKDVHVEIPSDGPRPIRRACRNVMSLVRWVMSVDRMTRLRTLLLVD